MSGELQDNAEKQTLAPRGERGGASLSRNTQELFNPLDNTRAETEPSAVDCGNSTSIYGEEEEIFRKRVKPPAENADVTVHEQPADQAIEPIPPLSDTVNQGPYNSPVKLNVQITQVPEVPQGAQNFDDLKALGTGIGRGLLHVGQETVKYLATPGSIQDSLLQVGPALDNAVNYYTNTPPEQVVQDAQLALGYAGQALENTLGHQLKPEQRGEHSGEAMAMMFPWGIKNAKVSEKFPELLATAENTSKEFGAVLEKAVEAFPTDVREFVTQNKTQIVGLKRLGEVAPDAPGDARGRTSIPENRIYIPEEVLSEGQWVKNDSISFSTRHEIGHLVNDKFGLVSERPAFVEKYKADLEKLAPEMIERLGKFAKDNPRARDELFCEIFALKTGASTSPKYEQFIRDSFPSVYELIGK